MAASVSHTRAGRFVPLVYLVCLVSLVPLMGFRSSQQDKRERTFPTLYSSSQSCLSRSYAPDRPNRPDRLAFPHTDQIDQTDQHFPTIHRSHTHTTLYVGNSFVSVVGRSERGRGGEIQRSGGGSESSCLSCGSLGGALGFPLVSGPAHHPYA